MRLSKFHKLFLYQKLKEISMKEKTNNIHDTVREYYAARAVSSDSCCEDSCCSSSLYSSDLLGDLPQDISEFSLGCGDPITQAFLQDGETVLDLGSGGGLDCFLAARQVGETGQVIGVDMTPEMIDRAGAAALKLGVKNVEFRQGFLEALPVENESVDVVISNCVINLSPDKPKVFSEIFRVLKSGGRVSVSDIVLSDELPELVLRSSESWSACISGAVQAGEYAEGLQSAGFIDVQVQPRGVFADALTMVPFGTPYSAAITAKKP
jgi:arsenite methyltransferase